MENSNNSKKRKMGESDCPNFKRQENGDILLIPHDLVNIDIPGSDSISTVTLSRMGVTFHWFKEFLSGSESGPVELKLEGRVYQLSRESGNVYLIDNRDKTFSRVGFSPNEVINILNAFKTDNF